MCPGNTQGPEAALQMFLSQQANYSAAPGNVRAASKNQLVGSTEETGYDFLVSDVLPVETQALIRGSEKRIGREPLAFDTPVTSHHSLSSLINTANFPAA